jgi:hypothetical protein
MKRLREMIFDDSSLEEEEDDDKDLELATRCDLIEHHWRLHGE